MPVRARPPAPCRSAIAWRQERWARRASVVPAVGPAAAAGAQALEAEEQQAVRDQESGGRLRRGEQTAQRVLEQHGRRRRRGSCRPRQPARRAVGVVASDLRSRRLRHRPENRFQSLRKKKNRTMAWPGGWPQEGQENLSFCGSSSRQPGQDQRGPGSRPERLGHSCRRPRMSAWKYEIGASNIRPVVIGEPRTGIRYGHIRPSATAQPRKTPI